MSMLETIKPMMGIAPSITIYDTELQFWIQEAKRTMVDTSGVPPNLFDVVEGDETTPDKRVVMATVSYVKANFGNDRSDTQAYMDMYNRKVRELQLEDGGIYDGEG